MGEARILIKRRDAEFNRQFKLICEVVGQNTAGASPVWTHISQAKITELTAAYENWETAYNSTLVPHTTVETEMKKSARAVSEKIVRRFIQRFFYDADDVVTDAQIISMELPPRDHIKTRHGKPAEHVSLRTQPHEAGELRIDSTCTETGKGGRPEQTYKGIMLYQMVLEPGDPEPLAEDLQESELATRSPYYKTWESRHRGKRVALSGAWVNGSGVEGDRCPPVFAVIP